MNLKLTPGTFMYHPHATDDTNGDGDDGLLATHPKNEHPWISADRDYCILLNAFDIVPGSETPNIMTMLDFNLWLGTAEYFQELRPLLLERMTG